MNFWGGGGGDKNLVDEEIFPGVERGGKGANFCLVRELLHSPVGKILVISTLHTHCEGHGFKPSAFLESHKSFGKLL